jgi:hypothetical protein
MRVSELMAALAPHCATNPEVFYGPYALLSVTQADPDNGRLYLTVAATMSPPPSLLAETEQQAEPEQAEPEQAAEQQAEPLTLEQRIEALEKRLLEDTFFESVADAIDYEHLAGEVADRVSLREVARCIDMSDLVSEIGHSDLASEVASEIYLSDLASEIDLSDLAGYVDTEGVAEHLDLTDLAARVDMSDLAGHIDTKRMWPEDIVRHALTTMHFRLDSSTD